MDELIDVLDIKTGEKIGKIISRSKAHEIGAWHGAIHILIVDENNNKTLLQKRCAKKDLYPNMWDVAVGGHISIGESNFESAKRELEEELGLNSNDYEIKFLEKVCESLENDNIINNEHVSIFIIKANINIEKITLQEDEVSEVKWCNKKELNEYIENKLIIPHIREYEILNEILN